MKRNNIVIIASTIVLVIIVLLIATLFIDDRIKLPNKAIQTSFTEIDINSCEDLKNNFKLRINNFGIDDCEISSQFKTYGVVGASLINISKNTKSSGVNWYVLKFKNSDFSGKIYISSKEELLPYEVGNFYRFNLNKKCPLIMSSASSGNFQDSELTALVKIPDCE